MADTKFTDLPALLEANINPAEDILAGVDISTDTTVKMVLQAIFNKVAAAITPTGGTMTITGILAATTLAGAGTGITGAAAGLSIGGNAATATTAATVVTNANLTGPITSAGNATTITAGAVTLAKMANIATASIMGRVTAGAGAPEVLTGTQATVLLDVFGTLKGLVPAAPTPTGLFLRDDATWAAGGGGGSGTVTSVSVVGANGFAGTVATSTTTPAITISTSITGILKGNATAISAAVANTDYAPSTSAILTTPDINAGTADSLTSLSVRNAGTGAFDLTIATNDTLTAGRTLTLNTSNVNRTLTLGGNAAFAGTVSAASSLTFAGPFITAGSFSMTLTATAATNVTLPTSGTLLASGGALGTPSSGTLSGCTVDGTNLVGFRNVPQNSKSAAYTTVLADAGKHIFHPSADVTARVFTIDSNANVPYVIGDALTIVNQNGAGVITIAITTDTMRLAGAGTTGSRTLAANGIATALKVTATEWIISGTGLT